MNLNMVNGYHVGQTAKGIAMVMPEIRRMVHTQDQYTVENMLDEPALDVIELVDDMLMEALGHKEDSVL